MRPVFRLRRPRGRRPLRRAPQRGGGPAVRLSIPIALVAAVGWVYVPVGTLTAYVPPPHRPQAAEGLPWLSTAGTHIVDEQGRTVLLHGFNSDALLEDGVRHFGLADSDAATMQHSGFNVVRLPIAWSRLEPARGRIDDTYLADIAGTVDMLNRHGLYVIFDMHINDWGPRFGGSGAPSWAALPLVPDLQWWPADSWRKHLSPAMNAATTYFWLSPDWQDDFQQVWRAVATRFRDNSGVAGYDLYNEPHPLPIPPRLFEQHWMWPLYARTITSIGSVDPNHLFIVEGTLFGNLGTTTVHLEAPQLVYSSHLYTGSLVPPDFDGNRGPVNDKVHDQLAEAAAVPAAFWSGELGIDHHKPHALDWADAALDAYDDAGAGWAWWQWRESSSWGVLDEHGTIDMPWLRHLARPYLRAAPQGVHGERGDGVRGTLRIDVDPGHAGGTVDVAWPALTLNPPTLSGECGTVSSWSPDAATLVVNLSPGQGCGLQVTAAPG